MGLSILVNLLFLAIIAHIFNIIILSFGPVAQLDRATAF